MKSFIFISLFLAANFAFAKTGIIKHQIPIEDSIGKYQINMDFEGDRLLTESIHMDVSVLCNDHRTNPNSAKPQLETVIKGEKFCAFDDFKFNKESKVLTIKYSTGEFDKKDQASCDDHWEQEIDTKEVCKEWNGDGARTPANDEEEVALGSSDTTDISARRRRHRGVRARTRIPENNYYNSSWAVTNPMFTSQSIFSGSNFGTNPQQGKYQGRDGLPRNSRREVVACPHLGVDDCLSAIFAAETSCNLTKRHGNNGYGVCAIENDKRRFRFGDACNEIRSLNGQATCCKAIIAKVGSAYFGGRTRRIAGGACGWR